MCNVQHLNCEAFSVDVHTMPLGELYRYCWFLGYFNNFRDTQEHITWKLLFQMDLHILLTNKTNIDTVESLSNEWHWEIQMFPLNSIFHGWPISVIRLDPVLISRLVLVSNPAGSHPCTARLAESRLFMWLSYSSVWKILNGTAQNMLNTNFRLQLQFKKKSHHLNRTLVPLRPIHTVQYFLSVTALLIKLQSHSVNN